MNGVRYSIHIRVETHLSTKKAPVGRSGLKPEEGGCAGVASGHREVSRVVGQRP